MMPSYTDLEVLVVLVRSGVLLEPLGPGLLVLADPVVDHVVYVVRRLSFASEASIAAGATSPHCFPAVRRSLPATSRAGGGAPAVVAETATEATVLPRRWSRPRVIGRPKNS